MKTNSIFMLALVGFLASVNLQAAQPEPGPQNWSEFSQLHTRSRFYRLTTAALCITGLAVFAFSKDPSMQLCGAGLAFAGTGMAGLDLAEQLALETQKVPYIQALEKSIKILESNRDTISLQNQQLRQLNQDLSQRLLNAMQSDRYQL